MLNLKLISKKINRKIFISRSKKISLAFRKIFKKPVIGIVDIGAGHRYLPILLNFDGVSKIAMVDPNKSLDWSFQNFKDIISYPENLFNFKSFLILELSPCVLSTSALFFLIFLYFICPHSFLIESKTFLINCGLFEQIL